MPDGSSSTTATNGTGPKTAIVLPGGGARGAYEAGALSVLLPELERRGERVDIVCGTSVGAINAALLGSLADRGADEIAEIALSRWRDMRKSDVIKPVFGPGLPLVAARFLGELLEVPGVRLASVLDPSPLQRSLAQWIDWLALHRNVKHGLIDAVCVVATALTRSQPVAFVETKGRLPRQSASDDLRYVRVPSMSPEHVRASAAIPVLFPPVEVTVPKAAADFYIDGGTRQNSPIAPALALGADRVVIIGFEPFAPRAQPPEKPPIPRMADVAANIVDGLLVDQVSDDLQRMVSINSFFVEGAAAGSSTSRSARAYRTARGRLPYRKISYALVAPERRGEMGLIADRVFRERYSGLRGLRDIDYPLMSRLLGGDRTRARGELLSFLLFDELFVEELLAAGAADAQRWLDRHPRFWCSDAAHDFHVDQVETQAAREQLAIDEWRSLRRR
ncbi:patatin [Conexibacter sp. W3-3-2]|uniref:Patatin n=1 Tax=Paraconexibacter algicola TaxID=2133960 RepID=A0A2T4UIF4_9ACTN|nr:MULTISPECIES: patatin-like phospholipase family protein [Solirubrobacterales]MTD45325.1 patatin [Conexibacter sp. W3-3-2]PTL59020.1 patatin [Paraconexibacter algicola]